MPNTHPIKHVKKYTIIMNRAWFIISCGKILSIAKMFQRMSTNKHDTTRKRIRKFDYQLPKRKN